MKVNLPGAKFQKGSAPISPDADIECAGAQSSPVADFDGFDAVASLPPLGIAGCKDHWRGCVNVDYLPPIDGDFQGGCDSSFFRKI